MNSFTSRTANAARTRAKYFIYIFGVLILCAAGLITQIMLNSAYTDQVTETERRLGEQVQSRASQLSLSMASLKNQVRYLANTDLLRLYTYEVYNLNEEKTPKSEEAAPQNAETPASTLPETPTATPTATPTETPIDPPAETPTETAIEAPAEKPADSPSEVPLEITVESSVEITVENFALNPALTSAESPAQNSAEAPAEAPVEIPADAPVQSLEEPSAELPEELRVNIPERSLAESPTPQAEDKSQEGEKTPSAVDSSNLNLQTPVMHKMLAKFARESTSLQVSLLTTEKTVYISSETRAPSIGRIQAESAENALKYGVMQVLPVYIDGTGRLVLDILFPVYPPLYVADKDSKPVGVLLVSSNLTETLQDLPAPDPVTGERWRLLQRKGSGLQEISPQKPPTLNPFSKWLNEINTIPFELRKLLDGSNVYAVAMNIADTPLYLSFEISQDYAEEGYAHYRKNLIILTVVCVICIFLLVGMAWWWLLGQREKAVSGELQSLYKKVHAQKQLLDKVNSAVPDGIVLKDLTGKIGYANDAFARIVNRPKAELIGEFYESLIAPLTTMKSLHSKSHEALETGTASIYNESLMVGGEKRLFQVITLPLSDEGSETSDLVLVYRDITDIEKAHEKSQHLTHQMVTVLVRSLETVDPYLSGQSMFTADLANRLARMMNLEFIHATTVRAAGSLSQLGMLQLPVGLRTKEGLLTPEELAQVHKHVEYTQEMLKGIDFGVPVQEAVYQMWEGMDGSGYPKGLKGAEISIDARILSVANTFCALMRPRAYRQAHDVQRSLEILAGPKFDSQIVATLNAFLLSPEGQDFLKRFSQM